MAAEEGEIMCEKCDSLQVRCDSIAKWLTDRGLHNPIEEDMDLLKFLTAKAMSRPIVTMDSILYLNGSCFLAGYKKGYEVHQLETMEKER